jgi:hypothetical protein
MYVQGYLQGSENGRVVTIGDQRDNPNNPVVILRFAILTHPAKPKPNQQILLS